MAKLMTMNGKEKLAAWIAQGTTQAQFARLIRCSDSHLSLILKGERQPSIALAIRIAAATGGAVLTDAWVTDEDAALSEAAQ